LLNILIGSRNKQAKHALLSIKFDKQANIVQSSLICKSNSTCTSIEISENGDLLVITFSQEIRVIDLKSINDTPNQNWPKYVNYSNRFIDKILLLLLKYCFPLFDFLIVRYKHPNKISCAAINSHKGFIAIGDLSGKITYWYLF
jgi:hypothetical protein